MTGAELVIEHGRALAREADRHADLAVGELVDVAQAPAVAVRAGVGDRKVSAA